VMLPDMETWIFGCLHHAEGCCNGAVTLPDLETEIFGFPPSHRGLL
jgi:hypothetical protein